ncbi:UPF0488 protein CG14286 [Chelonus insularis]|uniref:UPF0488 protein CG14286 n=1 Tax=Chelonus insularis TaxID=460826 RepID=UPI001588A1E9|nr:UPF0488 protein CG14286 [Chelonus insularis]
MPPKPRPKKLPKVKLPSKAFPPQVSMPVTLQENSSSSGLDPEAEDKFELELCWCVQQLELSLQNGKISDKHVKNTQKNLNLLKSNTVPLIQKRQIMRNTFGDYREKMLQEEKKHGKIASTAKFSTSKEKNQKALFVRKAHSTNSIHKHETNELNSTNDEHKQISSENSVNLSSLFSKNTSNNPFVFNFNLPNQNQE